MTNIIIKLLQKLGIYTNIVNYICGNEALPQPLDAEQEALMITLALAGDDNAKEKLVEHNLRLVVYLAKKFESTGLEIGRAHV